MGSWQGLGIATPTIGQWQILNLPSLGGETFRVNFFALGTNPQNRVWATYLIVDSLYSTGESGSSARIYPSATPEVIFLPIPPDFKQAGLVVRYLQVRKFSRRRTGRTVEPGWSVEVEEFVN